MKENNLRNRTFLTIADVAKRYNVTKATIYRWIKKGILPKPYKFFSTKTLFDLYEIIEWEENQPRFK